MQEIPDNTRSATPRSFQHTNIFEQRMEFALAVAHTGVSRAGVADEGSLGVIWNFTDTLTRVFAEGI